MVLHVLLHLLFHASSHAYSHLQVICFTLMLDYMEAIATTKFGANVKHTEKFLISLGGIKNWGVFSEIKQSEKSTDWCVFFQSSRLWFLKKAVWWSGKCMRSESTDLALNISFTTV